MKNIIKSVLLSLLIASSIMLLQQCKTKNNITETNTKQLPVEENQKPTKNKTKKQKTTEIHPDTLKKYEYDWNSFNPVYEANLRQKLANKMYNPVYRAELYKMGKTLKHNEAAKLITNDTLYGIMRSGNRIGNSQSGFEVITDIPIILKKFFPSTLFCKIPFHHFYITDSIPRYSFQYLYYDTYKSFKYLPEHTIKDIAHCIVQLHFMPLTFDWIEHTGYKRPFDNEIDIVSFQNIGKSIFKGNYYNYKAICNVKGQQINVYLYFSDGRFRYYEAELTNSREREVNISETNIKTNIKLFNIKYLDK